MAVYFVDRIVPDSKDDTHGTDSTLFGDILHIPRIGTFILDIVVGEMRPTPRHPRVIQSNIYKHLVICLQRENPLTCFDTNSSHKAP